AAHLVRIGLAGDDVREVRDAARVEWRAPAGETGHRKIEASPKEMHRARLADKAGAKQLEHTIALEQHAPKPLRVVRIVGRVRAVFAEADRFRYFIWHLVDRTPPAALPQSAHDAGEKAATRLRPQRTRQPPCLADVDAQNVVDEIECDLQRTFTVVD